MYGQQIIKTFNKFVKGISIRPTFDLGLIQRKSGR